ncbi:MAG: hypothetical protein AAFZ58_07275 [Pseudomonadota bacterium]
MLIIDCHGHCTTAPDGRQVDPKEQLARQEDLPAPPPLAAITNGGSLDRFEQTELRLLRECGSYLSVFSNWPSMRTFKA